MVGMAAHLSRAVTTDTATVEGICHSSATMRYGSIFGCSGQILFFLPTYPTNQFFECDHYTSRVVTLFWFLHTFEQSITVILSRLFCPSPVLLLLIFEKSGVQDYRN